MRRYRSCISVPWSGNRGPAAVACLSLLLAFCLPAQARVDVTGFADTYHAVRVRSPFDLLSSRTRLHLDLEAAAGSAFFCASVNLEQNNVVPARGGIELRTAYLEYAADWWDLRAGRQAVIWGKADGVAITDIVTPMDYSEFLARDYADLRLPVDALRARFLSDAFGFELVLIPVFKPAVLPAEDSPWSFMPEFPPGVDVVVEPVVLPATEIRNGELAARLTGYLSGIDLAAAAGYVWDDFPVMGKTVVTDSTGTTLYLRPEHHRFVFAGLEFSRPWSDFVLRGEAALYKDRRFETAEQAGAPLRKDAVNWLLGLDWYPGHEWTAIVQFADNTILGSAAEMTNEQHTMFATLNVSKRLLRSTLVLSTMLYFGINDTDLFDRTSVDYALTDEIHVMAGFDLFAGDRGMFGRYNENDEVWFKAKYGF